MELKNLYRGRIREYAEKYGCKYVEGAKPWGEKCDIALPSATQNELNGDHARQLVANGCIAVSEGANMPSTPEAIKVFQDAKILYAPGKAANAGGVSVSGLEMTQNSIKLSWSAEEVDEKLKSIMKNIHEACVQDVYKRQVLSIAFYIILFVVLLSLELFVVTIKSGDTKCDYDLIVEHQLNIKKNMLQNSEDRLLNK